MSWKANERYRKAYKDAKAIVEKIGWERGPLSNGEFAELVLGEVERQGLGNSWDEAVKGGVVDFVHGRPMR
jgi:hypothetical protein